MALSVFSDKNNKPNEEDLSESLGEMKALWDEIKDFVGSTYPPITEDWKHYGKSSGWCMKLLRKKRNLFFSYPGKGEFWLGFVFGDRAVEAVNQSNCPQDLIAELNRARKYGEGRGLKVQVKHQRDVEVVKILVEIKVNN